MLPGLRAYLPHSERDELAERRGAIRLDQYLVIVAQDAVDVLTRAREMDD